MMPFSELLISLMWPALPRDSRDTVEPIFDQTGKVLGWLFNDVVYDRQKRYRAVVRNGAVYSYIGCYLGYLDEAFFRDRSGQAVAFLSGARRGPVPPIYETPPEASTLPTPPVLPLPGKQPEPPTPRLGWSLVRWDGFLRGQVMAGRCAGASVNDSPASRAALLGLPQSALQL